jgi:hypothetical protein
MGGSNLDWMVGEILKVAAAVVGVLALFAAAVIALAAVV